MPSSLADPIMRKLVLDVTKDFIRETVGAYVVDQQAKLHQPEIWSVHEIWEYALASVTLTGVVDMATSMKDEIWSEVQARL